MASFIKHEMCKTLYSFWTTEFFSFAAATSFCFQFSSLLSWPTTRFSTGSWKTGRKAFSIFTAPSFYAYFHMLSSRWSQDLPVLTTWTTPIGQVKCSLLVNFFPLAKAISSNIFGKVFASLLPYFLMLTVFFHVPPEELLERSETRVSFFWGCSCAVFR